MTFLQPFILAALPLIALPLLIHLINQHRHRTMYWGAMMFLRTARRMTRGMARLRHILILLARTLAIAGLIFAIARPLASGWLGLAAGSDPDTTIVILDRSASMEQQDLQTEGSSKRATSLRKLSELLQRVGGATRLVLIESTRGQPQEVADPKVLPDLPDTIASSTASDMPALMQRALDYIDANQTGRTDIWVCSDLRANDWDASGGRWEGLRSGFSEKEGVRFYLLLYPRPAEGNVSVSVTNVHRRQMGPNAELVMDLRLRREGSARGPLKVPIQFVINGARSELEVEMADQEYERLGHTISIDQQTRSGHGRVELPNDSNPQDNVFYFVFSEPPVYRTVIVSDDKQAASLLRLAAETPTSSSVKHKADVLTTQQADEIPWEETALLVWHAPLPDELTREQLENFVRSGRTVVFLPPEEPGDGTIFGAGWGGWEQSQNKTPISVAGWNNQADLLANTQSGSALPVGELQAFRYCRIQGESLSSLATLDGGVPLLARAASNGGSVYFLSTLPQTSHSTMASDAVVLYVMVQRALASGAAALGTARQMDAGDPAAGDLHDWQPADESTDALLSQRPFQSGVWKKDDRLLALNRPLAEDQPAIVGSDKLGELMQGLEFTQINDEVTDTASLASEIWRSFLVAMAIALVLEALLCLPERRPASTPDRAAQDKPNGTP